jgi:hypothetical protein
LEAKLGSGPVFSKGKKKLMVHNGPGPSIQPARTTNEMDGNRVLIQSFSLFSSARFSSLSPPAKSPSLDLTPPKQIPKSPCLPSNPHALVRLDLSAPLPNEAGCSLNFGSCWSLLVVVWLAPSSYRPRYARNQVMGFLILCYVVDLEN